MESFTKMLNTALKISELNTANGENIDRDHVYHLS